MAVECSKEDCGVLWGDREGLRRDPKAKYTYNPDTNV